MNAQNSTRARLFRRSLMAMACAAAAAPTFAQNAAAPGAAASAPEQIQRVVVTGSRIKQIDLEGASPIQVINREEIRKTGVTSVQELLNNMTATSSGTATDISASNSFAPGASQASLRNLGAQATLVLLNGRRLPTFPLPDFQVTFANLDAIPLSAIDRVEVLKVGGSAIYGSDAIAGVINIITRSSYEGIEASGSQQASLQIGKFGQRSASLTGGLGNYDRDGYNLFGTVEWFQRDAVFWNGNVLASVNPAYKDVAGAFGSTSSYSFAGYLNRKAIVPSSCALPLSSSGACPYNRYSRFEAVPAAKRVNAILGGDLRLGGNTQWHTELQLSDVRVRYESAYATYGSVAAPTTWLNLATGQAKTFYPRGLPLTNPLNQTGQNEDENDFRYRFADSGAGETTHTTSYRLLSDLKGDWHDWSYDAAIGVMGGHAHDRSRGQYSESGFTQTVGDPGHLVTDPNDPNAGTLTPVAADFFNVAGGYKLGGPNTAAVLGTLFPQYGFDGTYRQFFVDASANTTIAQLPAGPLQLSLGAEARHESMVLKPTANLVQSDIVGFSLSQSDGSRNFEAAYTELQIPILKTMTANLAARVDKFPNISAHISPRANLEFRPVDILKLRGTVETGFRAPNLQESAKSSKSAYNPGVTDPLRCPAATQIANGLRADAVSDPDNADEYLRQADQIQGNECSTSVPIIAQNNPALKPETSLSKSFGAVLQVTRHWSVAADYWNIERRNEINLKSVNDLLASGDTAAVTRQPLIDDGTGKLVVNPVTDPTFTQAQLTQYNITAPSIASVKLQYANLFKTRTSGVDLGFTGDVDTPIGKWTSTLEGTYTANWQTYSPTRNGTGAWGDNLAGRYGYPRWQTTFQNSLDLGSFSHTLVWRHHSGTSLQGDFNDPSFTGADCAGEGLEDSQCKLSAYDRFDYSVAFTGIKDLVIGAYVQNVFGKRPPVDYRSFGGASGIIPVDNEDATRRLLKVSLNYKFK
ncbi:MAG: TonB-dependent receptor [Burkholderiaceae bacterium]